jgi:gamma-glutamylcyclotransferase
VSDEIKGKTWYFSYGSNMNRGTFVNRRGMHPLQTRSALLENYRLCFNLPIGRGVRAVANLQAQTGARTWGVLYLITVEESDHLDRTEGVRSGVYCRIPVDVVVDSGKSIAAFTYQSKLVSEGRKPSARYIGLLIEGARQHGLPADYLDFLQSFELAPDERLGEPDRS